MHQILVPFDFSSVARNALDYAVEIALASRSRITLLHVFSVPVIAADELLILPIDNIEAECMDNLNKVKEALLQKHSLEIDCVCKSGFPGEEVSSYAREHHFDLIVAGMNEQASVSEKLLGNTATTLISKSGRPVIVVGSEMRFSGLQRIVLAIAEIEKQDKNLIDAFRKFIADFSANIFVVNVVKDKSLLSSDGKNIGGVALDHWMNNIPHEFHQVVDPDIVSGINSFAESVNADLLVMIPRSHFALMNLIHEPNTRKMVFKLKKPILTLH